MNDDAPALSLRPATEADLRFVRASWFESYRHGGFAPSVAFPVYREGQHGIIEHCLKRGRCLVAYATAVPDEVCAWAVAERGTVHFVYTKQAYRRLGIAMRLIRTLEKSLKPVPFSLHTHDTRVGRSFFARVGTKFDPYLLYPPAVPRSST